MIPKEPEEIKTDEEILKDRSDNYGDAGVMYERYKVLSIMLDSFYCELNKEEDVSEACRGLLDMVALKIIRLVTNVKHKDSYQDLRNYVTLLEEQVFKK